MDASFAENMQAIRAANNAKREASKRKAALSAFDGPDRFSRVASDYADSVGEALHGGLAKPATKVLEGLEWYDDEFAKPIRDSYQSGLGSKMEQGVEDYAKAYPNDTLGQVAGSLGVAAGKGAVEWFADPMVIGAEAIGAMRGAKSIASALKDAKAGMGFEEFSAKYPQLSEAARELMAGSKSAMAPRYQKGYGSFNYKTGAGYKGKGAGNLTAQAGATTIPGFELAKMDFNQPIEKMYQTAKAKNAPNVSKAMEELQALGVDDKTLKAMGQLFEFNHTPYGAPEVSEALRNARNAPRDYSIKDFNKRSLSGLYLKGMENNVITPLGEHEGIAQYGMLHGLNAPKGGGLSPQEELYRIIRDLDFSKAPDTMGKTSEAMDSSAHAFDWYEHKSTLDSIGEAMGMPKGWGSSPDRFKDDSAMTQVLWDKFQDKVGSVAPSSNNASVVVENAKSSAGLQALEATRRKFGHYLEKLSPERREEARRFFHEAHQNFSKEAKANYRENRGLPPSEGGEKGFGFETDLSKTFLDSVFAGRRDPGITDGDPEKILSYASNRFGNRMSNTGDRHDVNLTAALLDKMAEEMGDKRLAGALKAYVKTAPNGSPVGGKAISDAFAKKHREYLLGQRGKLPSKLEKAIEQSGAGLSNLQATRWVGKENIANDLGLRDQFSGETLGRVVSDTSEGTGSTWMNIMRGQVAESMGVPPNDPRIDEWVGMALTGRKTVPPPLAVLSKDNLKKEAYSIEKAKARASKLSKEKK